MTVKELIEKLEKIENQDSLMFVEYDGIFSEIIEVSEGSEYTGFSDDEKIETSGIGIYHKYS
jgi:hypothetical protein